MCTEVTLPLNTTVSALSSVGEFLQGAGQSQLLVQVSDNNNLLCNPYLLVIYINIYILFAVFCIFMYIKILF